MLNFNLTIYLWYIFWQNIFTISMEMIEDISCNLNSITNPHLSLRDDPRPLCLVRRRERTPVSWAEGASPPGVPRAPPRSSPPSLYSTATTVLCCATVCYQRLYARCGGCAGDLGTVISVTTAHETNRCLKRAFMPRSLGNSCSILQQWAMWVNRGLLWTIPEPVVTSTNPGAIQIHN